jgi:menaquinone-dependent protoporphyrinogen IX oxidase
MRIGIIVYSQTGNTRSVVDRLADRLDGMGHSTEIRPITVSGSVQNGMFDLVERPAPDGCDAYVFAAQVQGFALSRVMKRYMTELVVQLPAPVAIVVTEQLPKPWMGGNRAVKAVKAMQGRLEQLDADIRGSTIVRWARPDREEQIVAGVEKIASLF